MVIDTVFGLKSTGVSLNDRFTKIAVLEAQRQQLRRQALYQKRLRQQYISRGIQLQNRTRAGILVAKRGQVARRSRPFVGQRGRGRPNHAAGQQRLQSHQPQNRMQVERRGRPSLRGRGVGRGGITRQTPVSTQGREPVTIEQLDRELDEYMSTNRAALDRQLDEYMAEAMVDIELG